MPRAVDMTGERYGRLVAVSLHPERFGVEGQRKWLCQCDCGNTALVASRQLIQGRTRSCGCLSSETTAARNKAAARINIQYGSEFGRLTVISSAPVRHGDDRNWYWACRCSCGEEKLVAACHLRSGSVVSCGCHKRDLAAQRTGPTNPGWKPELTAEDRRAWKRNAPASFVRAVLDEHGLFCVCCGAPYEQLHHMDSWAAFPLRRFRVDNVVPLCFDCHQDYHREYGRDGATFEKFMYFLGGS